MNTDIKNLIKEKELKQWQVAQAIGVSERTLIVWLRSELSEDKRQRIMSAIQRLSVRSE